MSNRSQVYKYVAMDVENGSMQRGELSALNERNASESGSREGTRGEVHFKCSCKFGYDLTSFNFAPRNCNYGSGAVITVPRIRVPQPSIIAVPEP